MSKQAVHKELYDPFTHYARGALYFESGRFTFVAYRAPYKELNDKSWKSEQAFKNDYRRTVAKKYLV